MKTLESFQVEEVMCVWLVPRTSLSYTALDIVSRRQGQSLSLCLKEADVEASVSPGERNFP